MDEAYSSAFEYSATAKAHTVHAAAGQCGIGRERCWLRGDDRRSAPTRGSCEAVSQGRLGTPLAGWSGNVVLHAFSRSPPSRAGVHARAPARVPLAEYGDVWNVELGEVVEGDRVCPQPRLSVLTADIRQHFSDLA